MYIYVPLEIVLLRKNCVIFEKPAQHKIKFSPTRLRGSSRSPQRPAPSQVVEPMDMDKTFEVKTAKPLTRTGTNRTRATSKPKGAFKSHLSKKLDLYMFCNSIR